MAAGAGLRPRSAEQADFVGSTRNTVAAMFRKDADPVLARRIADDMSSAPPAVAINADLSPTLVDAIRQFAPDYRAIVVERTGHFLMMEDPARFNPILDAEIARLVR